MRERLMSIRELAVQVVLSARKPLHIKEITERVLYKTQINSRTPQNTVNNALQKDPRVVRVGKGMFQIAPREDRRTRSSSSESSPSVNGRIRERSAVFGIALI
jgi:hypothetical protein